MGGDRLDCSEDWLHGGNVAQLGAAGGARGVGRTSDDRERIKGLEREVRELRQANEILRKASAYFAKAELDRPVQGMIAFIDDHRAAHGIEPICRVLPIAPSTYHDHAAKRADPSRLSARARRDAGLQTDIKRVWDANFPVYGVRKVWRQLQREAIAAPRCQVARLITSIAASTSASVLLNPAILANPASAVGADQSTGSPPEITIVISLPSR
jgi:hypothetical protein